MNRLGKAPTSHDSRSFGYLADTTDGRAACCELRDGRWGVWRPRVTPPREKRPNRTSREQEVDAMTRGGKNQPACAKKCDSP